MNQSLSDRVSVAPMMDWTDRHCRYFHRLLTRRALLYTEMVTTGALVHGDVPRHLRFDEAEHPVALVERDGVEPVAPARPRQLPGRGDAGHAPAHDRHPPGHWPCQWPVGGARHEPTEDGVRGRSLRG